MVLLGLPSPTPAFASALADLVRRPRTRGPGLCSYAGSRVCRPMADCARCHDVRMSAAYMYRRHFGRTPDGMVDRMVFSKMRREPLTQVGVLLERTVLRLEERP